MLPLSFHSTRRPVNLLCVARREDLEKYPEGSFPCLIKECGVYMSPWAVGGKPFYFPPDVGLPFDQDHNNYLLLQVRCCGCVRWGPISLACLPFNRLCLCHMACTLAQMQAL